MDDFLGGELSVDIAGINDFELSNIYHEAAQIVFANSKDANASGNPGVYSKTIYPLMTLWRQSLELNLKFLAKKLEIPSANEKKSGHDLVYYWLSIGQKTNNFINIWPQKYEQKFLSDVDNLIKDVDKIDPKSTAFRFAFNKDGSNALQGVTNLSYDEYSDRFTLTHYILRAIIESIPQN